MAHMVCSSCGRPLKTGFFFGGKVVDKPACKAPLCKMYGKPQ